MSDDRWNARKVTTLAIVVIYAIWVEVIALRAGEPWEIWWWALEIPFFLWIIAPIVTAYLLRWENWLFAISLAAIAVYSLYVYERDMFGPGARSTSAIIFIWLPIYQWIAVGLLVGGARLVRRWVK